MGQELLSEETLAALREALGGEEPAEPQEQEWEDDGMPYRLNPRNRREVQVKRKSGWVHKKTHKTVALAKKHVSALNINVHHPSKARKRRKR